VLNTCITPFTTARISTRRLPPPRLAAGIKFDKLPFVLGQIARVSQMIAVVSLTVRGRPDRRSSRSSRIKPASLETPCPSWAARSTACKIEDWPTNRPEAHAWGTSHTLILGGLLDGWKAACAALVPRRGRRSGHRPAHWQNLEQFQSRPGWPRSTFAGVK
jgi:hypothetical protein